MSFLRRKRRVKPSAAPAAETAPPSPPSSSPTRDGYGFVVKPAFADAYRAHVPMFVREEEERRERWMAFLERASDLTSPPSTSGTGLDAVEEILRHRDRGACSADAPRRERELESLVRGGVPMALRGELWQLFLRVDEVRVPGAYPSLVALASDGASDANETTPGVSSSTAASEDAGKRRALPEHTAAQIGKDVPRTFPGHAQLDTPNQRAALERVLRAFAAANPNVGYCQGMNFVCGVLLLLMEEEAAFWALGQILRTILPDYFEIREQMRTHRVDQEVLLELAVARTPRVVRTLDDAGCPLHAVASSWFMALFANALPWETALRVWDVTLFERTRAPLFQTALAVMELDQSASRRDDGKRKTTFAGGTFEAATTMASRAFDASQLVMHATCGHADVTWPVIEALFAKHATRMEREGRFDELDEPPRRGGGGGDDENDAPETNQGEASSSTLASSGDTRKEGASPTPREAEAKEKAKEKAEENVRDAFPGGSDASDADAHGWRSPGVPAPATRAKVVESPSPRGGASRGSRSSERRWRDVLAASAPAGRATAPATSETPGCRPGAARVDALREDDERHANEDDDAARATRVSRRETATTPARSRGVSGEDVAEEDIAGEDVAEEDVAEEDVAGARRRMRSLELQVRALSRAARDATRRADDAEKASASLAASRRAALEALADRDRAIARLTAQTRAQAALLRARDSEVLERHRASFAGTRRTADGE